MLRCLVFGILIVISSLACQQAEHQSSDNDIKLFADYHLRYLQSETELKAEASFFQRLEKNNMKKIDLEGHVFINDQKLKPLRINNTVARYQLEQKQSLQDNYQFILEHDSGQKNVHKVNFSAIKQFSISNNIASKTTGLDLTWEGNDFQKEEQLLVLITDKNSKTHSIKIDSPTKNQKAHIDGQQLQGLVAGKGYIYLVGKNKHKQVKGNIQFSSTTEYYSNEIWIEIQK